MHENMHKVRNCLWMAMKRGTKCVPRARKTLWGMRAKTLWGMLDLRADSVL